MRILICCIAGLFALACLFGCEPRVASPFTGKPATAAEITHQHDAAVANARAAAEKDARDARDAAEASARQAEADARKAKREYEAAVAKLDADSAAAVAEATNRFESTLDALKVNQETSLARAATRASDAAALASRQIAEFGGQADAALAEIDRQKQAIAGIAGLVKFIPGAAAVPGLGEGLAVLTSVLGVGAAGVQTVRKRSSDKAARAATELAKEQEARVEDLEKSARSIVNMLDVLRAKTPVVAEAMKNAKGDFVGQLTDTAKKIIQDERIT